MAKKKENPEPTENTPKVQKSIEIYQRKDCWWSFRINGQESRYRSSSERGLDRTIQAIMFGGKTSGTVVLKPLKGKAKAKMVDGQEGEEVELVADSTWSTLPTQEERIAAFLSRGKLAKK